MKADQLPEAGEHTPCCCVEVIEDIEREGVMVALAGVIVVIVDRVIVAHQMCAKNG